MSSIPRKKSPRAPSFSLGEAIERAIKVYDKEKRHPSPVDAVAQHLGYKSATNGAAMSAFATLRYYGLVERPREGMLAISKDVESYKFAPDEKLRQELVLKWLRTPLLFSELLDQYEDGLPSDANIKYELIQRGFNEKAADAALVVFRRSLDYANYFELQESQNSGGEDISGRALEKPDIHDASDASVDEKRVLGPSKEMMRLVDSAQLQEGVDRIPVRLSGGRRAWIEIPTPFLSADKERLKAQIDLLLADDEGEGES